MVVIAVLYLYFGLHLGYLSAVFEWDIILHFLGGLWVALACAWIFTRFGMSFSLWQCVLVAALVGGAWEVYEYAVGMPPSVFMDYRLDTVKDIILDVLGGALAAVIIPRV